MDNKTEKMKYRQWAKDLRHKLDLKKISTKIENKLKMLDGYKSAKTVMSYMAKDIEVSLSGLFEDKTKNWYLPAVGGKVAQPHLLMVPYVPGKTKLIKIKFDILQPEVTEAEILKAKSHNPALDLIFVPGLCFDKAGNRIGFGRGYYDRFLKLNPESFKIGCCPKECLLNELPRDSWDERVDLVITD